MTRTCRALLVTMGLSIAAACTTLTDVEGHCGAAPQQSTCFGLLRVPKRDAYEYEAATTLAIGAVASPQFRAALEDFIVRHSRTGGHAGAWEGLTTDSAISGLLGGFNGMSVSTMSDLSGQTKRWIYHTRASEGVAGGPIWVNPVYRGERAFIANTFAHEAAHRIPLNLSHPHYHTGSSSAEKQIGLCEPPYVIGSLVERQIAGKLDPGLHCYLLFE